MLDAQKIVHLPVAYNGDLWYNFQRGDCMLTSKANTFCLYKVLYNYSDCKVMNFFPLNTPFFQKKFVPL